MTNGVVSRGILATVIVVLALFAAPLPADEPAVEADNPTAFLEKLQWAYAALAERVSPSVVAIRSTGSPSGVSEAEGPGPVVTTGSGLIVRKDGVILTSQHVVSDALAIDVMLSDGRRYRARVLAADERSDLAVLRIQATDLPIVKWGDADRLERGHIVLAMGNAHGASGDGRAVVSAGLVGGVGRALPNTFGRESDRYYGAMIQFSAPIGPGNSGGPLIDIHGNVVGVVTARGLDGAGVGYAVPIDRHTRRIINRLQSGRQFEYGYFGAEVSQSSHGHETDVSRPAGAMIVSVERDGPADLAGLCHGDRVTSVAGEPIGSNHAFVRLVGELEVERVVSVEFVRDGKRHVADVTIGRRPPHVAESGRHRRMDFRGATLGEVSARVRAYANLPQEALLVMLVRADTPAHRAGLNPGDVVVRLEGAPPTPEALASIAFASDRDVLLGLANGGSVLVKAP